MAARTIVLGTSPVSRAFLAGPAADLDLVRQDVTPVNRAFRPMVEQARFDVSELAIVTAIQAVEAGCPVVPLPITVAARFQTRALVQNTRFTDLGPKDLEGRRIAVRAYSQTTAAWIRTALETEYGVDLARIEWVTQELSHVPGAPEPDNVRRDPDAAPPEDLLRDGRVDAAVFGLTVPDEPWLAPVIPDPDRAARESLARTGVVQINHVVCVSRSLAEQDPGFVRKLAVGFVAAKAAAAVGDPDLFAVGAEAMRPSVEVLLGSVCRQGLTRRRLSFDDVFGPGAAFMP